QDDPEQVIAMLEKLATAQPEISAVTAPRAFFIGFADSGINFELLYWLDSPDINGQQVRSTLNTAIWKSFTEAGFSFPYPQREVRLLGRDSADENSANALSGKA